jgi:probable HAF family extracellular repeat protein
MAYSITTFTDPLGTGDIGGDGFYLNVAQQFIHPGTGAFGINNAGQITGYYIDSSGVVHGYVADTTSSNGTVSFSFSTVGGPLNPDGTNDVFGTGSHGTMYPSWGANGDFAENISDSGLIVGFYGDPSQGTLSYGFLLNGSSYSTLVDPLASGTVGYGTVPRGINNSGEIVGDYFDNNGSGPTFLPFLYDSNTQTFITLPNFPGSQGLANGISNNHLIVGSYLGADNAWHGFVTRETSGVYTSFTDPLGINTVLYGINDQGQVVGSYEDSNHHWHAFLADDDKGQITYTTIGVSGVNSFAYGINDSGEIVGTAINRSGEADGFLATPIHGGGPESMALLGVVPSDPHST